MTISLTDDEVLGIAYLSNKVRTRPLATVDLEDTSALAQAIARGLRSLGVRGMLGRDGAVGATVQRYASAAVESVRLGAYLLDDAGRLLTNAAAVEVCGRFENGWVVGRRTVLGTHSWRMVEDPELRAAFGDAVGEMATTDARLVLFSEAGVWERDEEMSLVPVREVEHQWVRDQGEPTQIDAVVDELLNRGDEGVLS